MKPEKEKILVNYLRQLLCNKASLDKQIFSNITVAERQALDERRNNTKKIISRLMSLKTTPITPNKIFQP